MHEANDIKIKIPEPVKKILAVLNGAGEEAYVVGGCVRDCVMGLTPSDWDITTSALPEKVKSLFCHTVDTGLEHGTVTVIMNGCGYEVTTYRLDGKYSDGRHPDNVEFTPSLAEDLKRRDFTINAFAYNDEAGFVDMFCGLSDLQNRIIRCVGDPDRRFGEDALRIMRAVRFAAKLSFEIEENTGNAISRHAEALGLVSMERIRVELEKTLMSDNPSFVNKYAEYGLAPFIIRDRDMAKLCFDKESEKLYEKFQGRALNVFSGKNRNEEENGTKNGRDCKNKINEAECKKITGNKSLPGDSSEETDDESYRIIRNLRLAAFLKNVPAENAAGILRKLTYDNKTKRVVTGILKYKDANIIPDRRYIKRAMRDMGDDIFDYVIEFKRAVLAAEVQTGDCRCMQARCESDLDDIADIASDIRNRSEAYKISMLAVNGGDLIEAGLPKGVIIGEALSFLLEAVINEPEGNEKEVLTAKAREKFRFIVQ